MRRNTFRRHRSAALALAAAAAAPLVASAANTDVYVGASGTNWNNTNDWLISGTSTHVIPAAADTVVITLSPTSLFSVTYDGNYTSLTAISSLTLDGSATFGVVLNQGTAGDNLFSIFSQVIGNTGIATFSQTAATNSVGGNLLLGNASSGQGTYLLGTGASLLTANTVVGAVGHGSFSQTGGAHTISSELFLGSGAGSNGSYSLSSGSLTAPNIAIGSGGTGLFNQSGGTNTISGALTIGNASGAVGSYSLGPSALLSVGSGGETLGAGGNGAFIQTGGANTFVSNSNLILGFNAGSTGSYTLSAGSLGAFQAFIGVSGQGTFIQNGGAVGVGNMTLGDVAGGSGVYQLSGGTINEANNTGLFVGGFGPSGTLPGSVGSFIQSGGTASLFALTVGANAGSTGLYSLSSTGSLSVGGGGEFIGYAGTGSLVQTGGAHTTSSLTLGQQSAGNGSYMLAPTATLSVTGLEAIGNGGAGAFTQTGGTNTAAALFVGNGAGATGTYALTGGTLSLSGVFVPALAIGFSGTGTFTQSAGNVSVGGSSRLWIGANPGSHGVYNFSGGTASALFVTIGGGDSPGGTGLLNVSGTATLTVFGELGIFNTPGSSLNFSGGTITAGDINDLNVPSNFVWTGGALTLTNSSVVFDSTATGPSASLGSTVTLNSGQTLALSNGNETIGGGGAGSLTLNGGSTNTISGSTTINPLGTFTLNGGTLNTSGTLLNFGNFTYYSGTLTGRLVNQGSASIAGGSNFSPTNGAENDATLTVAGGATFTVNGAGLDNLGTFSLNNGTIAGTATFTNDFGGVMSASGTINQGLTNNGTLNLNGVLSSNGAVLNNGVINVPSATNLRGSGGVSNAAVINLTGGAISSAFANNPGGVVQGSGAITNPWTNSGLVILQGGTGLSGGAITNAGTIQGNGLVNATVLNTTGAIQPTGGQLVLAGAGISNGASGQIQITTGNTLFISQGLATNSGTIALSGGTFDNNNQPLTNNAAISGNGTLRTGGLTNSAAGTISLADVVSNVLGAVSNSGHINITNNTTTFFGTVTNNPGGSIKVTTGVSRFLSTFTNNGTFSSDPATNYFQNVSVGPQGILLGGSGDQFIVNGDLLTTSTRNTAWNTAQALLEFTGGENHTLSVAGTDEGPAYAGFDNNFSWGILQLDSGNVLTVQPDGANAALYVRALVLADGLGQLSNINSDGVNVYYDPGNPANGYLADLSYALGGGGELAPVPEPVGCLLIAIAPTLLVRRRAVN